MKFFKKKEAETAEKVEEPAVEAGTEPVAPVEEAKTDEVVETPAAEAQPVDTPAEEAQSGKDAKASKKDRKSARRSMFKPRDKSGNLPIDPELQEDTVIKRTDEEAHRNVKYNIPSKFVQTQIAMMVELKRICKTSIFIATFILGIVMVVIVSIPEVMKYLASFLDMIFNYSMVTNTDGPAAYMATMLALLPFLGVFYCASNMSQSLPSEFKDRTVFLHFGLPVSKNSYYIGKFIADFLPVLAMIFIGYGFAYVCTSFKYGDFSASSVLVSLATSILTAFALSSMIFCMSAGKKKGSTIRALALIVVLIPIALMVTSIIGGSVDMLKDPMDTITQIIAYLPTGGFDVALYQLDSADIMLSPSALNALGDAGYPTNKVSLGIALAVYLVWGLLFMARGSMKFSRRQL